MLRNHHGTPTHKETKGPSCLGGTFLRDFAAVLPWGSGLGSLPTEDCGIASSGFPRGHQDRPIETRMTALLRPFYFHDHPVSVEEMGTSRETFQEAVSEALQEVDLLLTYRLNVPGPWKKSPLLSWALDRLSEDLQALLAFITSQPPYLHFLGERRVHTRGGDLGILLLQAPEDSDKFPSQDRTTQVQGLAIQLKQILQAWEERLFFAYLPDIDVYYRGQSMGSAYSIHKVFRTSLGAKPRPCFICQDRTGVCLRQRRHSVALMEATLFSDLFALFLHGEAPHLSALATSALIQELALSPKPGLVSGADPGIHTDMDLEAMAHSISLFEPYFARAISLASQALCSLLLELEGPAETRISAFQDRGEAYSNLPYLLDQLPPSWRQKAETAAYADSFDRIMEASFQDLRSQGLQLQRAMGQRTGGANTLFGQIFTMGLMVFAIAFLAAIYMGRGRWAWDLIPASYRANLDLPSFLGTGAGPGVEIKEATEDIVEEVLEEGMILRDFSALVALLSRPVRNDQLRTFFQNLHAYLYPNQLPPAYEALQEKLAALLTQEGSLCYKDLENIYHDRFIRVLGARAGALYGLPTVVEVGLPSLHGAKKITTDRVTILSYTLLRLMAADGDTCALKRNPSYYFHLQKTLPARLDNLLQEGKKEKQRGSEGERPASQIWSGPSPAPAFEEGVRSLMAELRKEAQKYGYSPGGAADHLAQTIFASDALCHLAQIRSLYRAPEASPDLFPEPTSARTSMKSPKLPCKGDSHA